MEPKYQYCCYTRLILFESSSSIWSCTTFTQHYSSLWRLDQHPGQDNKVDESQLLSFSHPLFPSSSLSVILSFSHLLFLSISLFSNMVSFFFLTVVISTTVYDFSWDFSCLLKSTNFRCQAWNCHMFVCVVTCMCVCVCGRIYQSVHVDVSFSVYVSERERDRDIERGRERGGGVEI